MVGVFYSPSSSSKRLERPSLVAPSLVVAAWAIGVGLSAIRAAAARQGLHDLGLFAGTGVLDKVPDVDDTIGAGVGARPRSRYRGWTFVASR
jgi:hypothetical protein